jgi:ectoine hydroxylase-related dioxygenase (phytanoyl-CoA dioxygenase family)
VAGLTAEQRASFDECGYVLLTDVFNRRDVSAMANEATRLAQWQVAISLALGGPTPRIDVRRRNGDVVLRQIQPVNDVSPVFARYARDERLMQPLRDLLGCEPVLMEEKLDCKQVLPGNPDVARGDDDEALTFYSELAFNWLDGYPLETLSSLIFIDDTTAENPPVRVVPRSHRREWPVVPTWPPTLADGSVRSEDAVPLFGASGSVVILHAALVRTLTPNRSSVPRRVMQFSHYPETFEMEHDKRNRRLRRAGQQAEERYEELVYSGVKVPDYRLR